MTKLKSKREDIEIINKIQRARSKNNINWMNVLRLALKHSPKRTKILLKKINSQDNQISQLLKKLI
mgnify:CR=1 FL=1|tara:strand:+ start:279 stop:476 length:198 start_codon:yes stop_codon:yes gene_type:complete